MDREELNHQAYNDVLDCNDPSYPENEVYMEYYRFWKSVDSANSTIKFM